jgi:hypothetical protein
VIEPDFRPATKPAAHNLQFAAPIQVALERRFEYFYLECLAENDFPVIQNISASSRCYKPL